MRRQKGTDYMLTTSSSGSEKTVVGEDAVR